MVILIYPNLVEEIETPPNNHFKQQSNSNSCQERKQNTKQM